MGSAVIFGLLCLLLPFIAYAIINEGWYYNIPLIGIIYKPWRFFLVVCSLPGIFALLGLHFMPESPKFIFNQGDKLKTIEIIKKIDRWNNGKNSHFEIRDLIKDDDPENNQECVYENEYSKFSIFKAIRDQAAPLFEAPYLSSIILICLLQFFIFYTSTG